MTRFSQLYGIRGKPVLDSGRARNRIGLYIGSMFGPHSSTPGRIITLIEIELGYDDFVNDNVYEIEEFLKKSSLSDFLDAITIILKQLQHNDVKLAQGLFSFVSRVLKEENLSYKLGEDFVVHPFVDVEFEENRTSALSALNDPRFGEARRDFEDAFKHLRNAEYKQAIRTMFPCVETAIKVLFPNQISRLSSNDVERLIIPLLCARYTINEPALNCAKQMLSGFKKWIDGSHNYRHGQEVELPTDPPQDLAIVHLSTGATYIRWIISLSS